MMWLGNITIWNQYTDSTRGEICTQNEDKMTWTKYYSKTIQNTIISDCDMSDSPIQSM